MNILLKSAKIIDDYSPFNNSTKDILIKNGKVKEIGDNLSASNLKVISLKNLHISCGWFDSSVSFGDPGFEERETFNNGLLVSCCSGYTHIAYNTNTDPKPESKADISHLIEESSLFPTKLYPKARISLSNNINNLTPLREMHSAGAICFSNYKNPISNPNLLKLALQYSSDFDAIIESFPLDYNLANDGLMNEGLINTKIGITGIPKIAEEIQIARDIEILRYYGGRLHIPNISSKGSVALIKKAKKDKLNLSCSVSIQNLCFTDEKLNDFNTSAKLLPPLRDKNDMISLRKALLDGTIDMVTSDHSPINIELKDIEFNLAHFGSIGLENTFGALLSIYDINQVISILNRGKELFGIPNSKIDIGSNADFTLFEPSSIKTVSNEDTKSTSKNNIFVGYKTIGSVYGIISNEKIVLNS